MRRLVLVLCGRQAEQATTISPHLLQLRHVLLLPQAPSKLLLNEVLLYWKCIQSSYACMFLRKSGSLSIDEVKQASDGSLSSSCRDENHSLRSNPPTTSSFTNRLPTVLDSSLRTSSGLGCESDVDPVKSVSQPSETVWVQKVEDSKVSLEASSK